jgi:hypothetical protein
LLALHQFYQRLQMVRVAIISRINERDVLATGVVEAGIAGGGAPADCFVVESFEAVVPRRIFVANNRAPV